MKPIDVTPERLRELLHYDTETGELRWRVTNSNRVKKGTVAGCRSHDRLVVSVDGRLYQANRLVWLHVHSIWPAGVIDHINGNARDNRIENLRDVTQTVNQQNRRRACVGSTSALLGVSWSKRRQKWLAQIRIPGKGQTNLGARETEEEAHELYLAAKRQFHAGCTI